MTVPLAVLAILAIFGGWINVPPSVHDSDSGASGCFPCPSGSTTGLSP